jgi:DNA-binding protein HU-beta
MIKIDIINEVAKVADISKGRAETAVETIFSTMKNALKEGERIELRGFGVFEVKSRKTGIGRNPRTGEIVPIAPGKKVRFKPGKEIKNL